MCCSISAVMIQQRGHGLLCVTRVVQCNVQFTGRLSAKRLQSIVNRDLICLYSMKNYRQALTASLPSLQPRRLNPRKTWRPFYQTDCICMWFVLWRNMIQSRSRLPHSSLLWRNRSRTSQILNSFAFHRLFSCSEKGEVSITHQNHFFKN